MALAGMTENGTLPVELASLLKSGRLPHAVALQSADQKLLQQCAQLLTQWAACTCKENRPCGKCPGCIKAQDGTHPDVYTAQSAGKTQAIPVDEIRKICMDAYIVPNEAQGKVYRLFDADKMLPPAQNAFLKVLEEPPQNILFLLTCENAENLLQTIRSRVTVFNLDAPGSQAPNRQENEKAYTHALLLAKAACAKKETGLLKACAALSDKAFAKEVLQAFIPVVRQALSLRYKNGAAEQEETRELSRAVKPQGLLGLIETANRALGLLERNVNMALFTAWLSSTLWEQKYK